MKAFQDFSDLFVQVNYNVSTDWSMTDVHFHDYFEMNLSISGGNNFFVNDQIHYVEPGDLFLFNTHDLHKTIVPKDMLYERYVLFFNPTVIHPFLSNEINLLDLFNNDQGPSGLKISLQPESLLTLRALLDDIIYNCKSSYYNNKLYMQIKLAEVLLLIHKVYYSETFQLPENSNQFDKTKEILDYINLHLCDSLTLTHLAKVFFINKSYLCEKFKKDTGFTINQYITNRRILKSRELLIQNYSISEVTEKIGYENDSHFIRTFKKLNGITPKQYALNRNNT